jgi:hypothetical protein
MNDETTLILLKNIKTDYVKSMKKASANFHFLTIKFSSRKKRARERVPVPKKDLYYKRGSITDFILTDNCFTHVTTRLNENYVYINGGQIAP